VGSYRYTQPSKSREKEKSRKKSTQRTKEDKPRKALQAMTDVQRMDEDAGDVEERLRILQQYLLQIQIS
jgi:hypothetical protein